MLLSAGLVRHAVSNCQGRVLPDDVAISSSKLEIDGCAQVILNQCDMLWSTTITDSTVAMSGCSVRGRSVPGEPGLMITQASVHLARTDVEGGGFFSAAHGIVMAPAQVTLAGDSTNNIAASPLPSPAGFTAIGGTGTLTLDPDVTLTPTGGAAAIEPTIAVLSRDLPSLTATGAPLGGTLTVDLHAEPGDLFVLFVGIPAPTTPIPVYGGPLWIDPATSVALAAGLIDGSGHLGLSLTLTNAPGLVGAPFGWVAIAGATLADHRMTNNIAHTQSQD